MKSIFFLDTPQKIVPGLPHNPYHASLQMQNILANPQDKYAPFHELTSDMESLSINWNGSRFSGGLSVSPVLLFLKILTAWHRKNNNINIIY